MGKHFNIKVYQTNQLGDELENQGMNRYAASGAVKKFMDGAFDHGGNQHTAYVVDEQTDVYAPTQDSARDNSFSTNDPCGSPTTKSYPNLGGWWSEYADCNISLPDDCVLLLTAGGGGGLTTQNFYAIAERGVDMAKLNSRSYREYGCGAKWGGMQTALHETAHALVGSFDYEHEDSDTTVEHDLGNVYQHDCGYFCSNWYRTPIGHGADSGINACGNNIEQDHDNGCEAMYWDPDCATNKFSHTTNHQ